MNRLWNWFGLSYAGWITLPRVLCHEMPQEWQDKMADLMEEWDATWNTNDMPTPTVTGRATNGRLVAFPKWVTDYRHPNRSEIDARRMI